MKIRLLFVIFVAIVQLGCINKKPNTSSESESAEKYFGVNGLETFLTEFLETCFFNQNFDSLLHNNSEIVQKFLHPEVEHYRYYKPGAICLPVGYSDWEMNSAYRHNKYPAVDLTFFPEKFPDDGLCEPSSDPDGIYYSTDVAFPTRLNLEDFSTVELEIPGKYRSNPLVTMKILFNNRIIKTLSFISINNRWWLFIIDDCDCGA